MKAVLPPALQPQTEPEALPPEATAPVVVRPAVAARARLARARVLVVEDDDDARELICALLEMAGATCLCVASVAEAMDGIYHSFDPDVVLTDFSMPDANGLDLIRQFREV